MGTVCVFRRSLIGVLAVGLVSPLGQISGQRLVYKPLVFGLEFDSDAFRDSLAKPFWQLLAKTPCPVTRWTPDFSSNAAYAASVTPLRKRLLHETGSPLPPAGSVVQNVVVYRGPHYSIERALISSRIPGARSFGYVIRPTPANRRVPALVLLHGTGMAPVEAFRQNATYRPDERPANATFIGSALEFAEAGYVVFIPWMANNSLAADWQEFPWATLERNGAALRPRVKGLGPSFFLINEISAGVDYVSALPEVDAGKVVVAGWGEGSQLAAMAAATDRRFSGVVRLSAPLDRHALREVPSESPSDARFTHADCALGDSEMAALIAPRALLYAYGTNDETVARTAQFISLPIANGIRELYARMGQPNNFLVTASPRWSLAANRRVRLWVDNVLGFAPRAVPDTITAPRVARDASADRWIDSVRADRQGYSASLGACVVHWPHPDLSSIPKFLASVEPFRQEVARELGVPIATAGVISVLDRRTIARRRGYSLQFVRVRSTRLDMVISGLLAVPDVSSGELLPVVVSADGDAGLAAPFGLFERERIPYLNEYADALASAGTIVFVPYYPFEFPEIAAAEAAARTSGSKTSFSYTVPMFSAAADFVLSLPNVDHSRVGIWGISFGGIAALYSGALDQRYTSVVFSDPIVSADVLFETQTSSSLAAWWPEICSTVDAVQAYLIAPRQFIRENGLGDANGYERVPLESVNRIRSVYEALGIPARYNLVRHTGGHETRARSVRQFLP